MIRPKAKSWTSSQGITLSVIHDAKDNTVRVLLTGMSGQAMDTRFTPDQARDIARLLNEIAG